MPATTVVDHPPPLLAHLPPPPITPELLHIHYTPIPLPPEEYSLPQHQQTLLPVQRRRWTELLITVTLYNEPPQLLARTLHSIQRNIAHFCRLKGSSHAKYDRPPPRGDSMWSEDGWQQIVVCIIADGRHKINNRTLMMLQQMGLYQPGLMHPSQQAHLFECTSQISIDEDLQVKTHKQGVPPVQYMLLLKEHNLKKLNSHKWLFRAFAPLLNPYICILIDAGTAMKSADSIYHLWRVFDRDLNVAGACGEICVDCSLLETIKNPLVGAQNFEYKISNVLDKPLESCFGYISVLPGAFSAYRWEALIDNSPDEGPLHAYFKENHAQHSVFEANMYLAEDRILCLELVAKRDSKWLLRYVSQATAETDAPSSAHEFISQRRRWLNGTFFCQLYAVSNIARLWSTRHPTWRKLALTFQFLYIAVTLAFSWLAPANFYLLFVLLTRQTLGSSPLFELLQFLYASVVAATFIISLGNRPQGAQFIYVGSMAIFSIIMAYLLALTVTLVVQSWLEIGISRDIIISFTSTFGVYFIASLLHGQLHHIVTCIVQYLLLVPSYVNTLSIYAFCNAHDISWGTKGDNAPNLTTTEPQPTIALVLEEPTLPTPDEQTKAYQLSARKLWRLGSQPVIGVTTPTPSSRDDYYKNFRTWFVMSWVLTNGFLLAVVSNERLLGGFSIGAYYIAFIMYFVAGITVFRGVGSMLYLFPSWRRRRRHQH